MKARTPNNWYERDVIFAHDSKQEANSNASSFSQQPKAEKACRFIASAYRSGIVVVRRAKDGHLVCVIDDEIKTPKLAVAFSSDRLGLLYVASLTGVTFYHCQSRTVATRFRDENRPFCIALSPSGLGLCYGTQRAGGRQLVVCALVPATCVWEQVVVSRCPESCSGALA